MRGSSILILGAFVIIVASIADKGAFTDSFFGISFAGFFFTLFKSLIVILIVAVSLPIALVALLIDLVLWFFTSYYFPLINFIWDLVAERITLSWYWANSNGNELFLSGLVIGIIGFVARRYGRFSFG